MELLRQRIIQDGRCLDGGILKVDSFINHQMDPLLMRAIAVEFAQRFAGMGINKIVTIEASGIAPSIMMGYLLELPVVFIKKKEPKIMENALSTVIHSFTKDRDYTVCVSNDFLKPTDRIVFIDDFVAQGNAALGVMELLQRAQTTLVGMGFIIEKSFQNGGEKLRARGVKVESLVKIKSLDGCNIVFED